MPPTLHFFTPAHMLLYTTIFNCFILPPIHQWCSELYKKKLSRCNRPPNKSPRQIRWPIELNIQFHFDIISHLITINGSKSSKQDCFKLEVFSLKDFKINIFKHYFLPKQSLHSSQINKHFEKFSEFHCSFVHSH